MNIQTPPQVDRQAVSPLIDSFGRQVTYLRLSLTDRCDMRCTYCMAEKMTFLPKSDLLTLDELETIGTRFIARGVKKIRPTGGEPLVRKDFLPLLNRLGTYLGQGLEELTLTTNGTLLDKFADDIAAAGVKRINVSLDTIDPEAFRKITRRGDLSKVLAGLKAAQKAGLKIKINTVLLKNQNAPHIKDMVAWAHGQGMSDENNRDLQSGPAHYVRVQETGGRLGFITPLTQNFCAGCNRVRVTCTGRIYMCLGQDDHIDLRDILRGHDDKAYALDKALDQALFKKPEKHEFEIKRSNAAPAQARHMSMTGG